MVKQDYAKTISRIIKNRLRFGSKKYQIVEGMYKFNLDPSCICGLKNGMIIRTGNWVFVVNIRTYGAIDCNLCFVLAFHKKLANKENLPHVGISYATK